MNTSDILNKAADLIEERGWTWGTGWPEPEREGQKLCLEGGIMAAVGLTFDEAEADFWFCPAYRAVQAHLDRPEYLFKWNDRASRTQGEVIEVLRATAVIEAAREAQPAEVSA